MNGWCTIYMRRPFWAETRDTSEEDRVPVSDVDIFELHHLVGEITDIEIGSSSISKWNKEIH